MGYSVIVPAPKLFFGGNVLKPDTSKPKYILAACYTQDLYGEETLKFVDKQGREVFDFLNERMPFDIEFAGTIKTQTESEALVAKAMADPNCIGIAGWAHTFSPTGMHLNAFKALKKPFINVITSYDGTIPENIDMDYMNLNQTPHGFQELGHGSRRSGIYQNPVAGHYRDSNFIRKFDMLGRVAAAVNLLKYGKILTIGGKMPDVSGTAIDPAVLQEAIGTRTKNVESSDLYAVMQGITRKQITSEEERLHRIYDFRRDIEKGGDPRKRRILLDGIRQSLAVRQMVSELENCIAWTSYFGNLGPLQQLPGFAAQDTMFSGVGYGAEGDKQAAALVAALLTMGKGRPGAASFSEPYVFDWNRRGTQYAHMIESSPALADGRTLLEVEMMTIGGKGLTLRSNFDFAKGLCILTSLYNTPDLGMQLMSIPGRIIDTPTQERLRVGKGLVEPDGDLETVMECAAYAGKTHHPGISTQIDLEFIHAFANMMDMPHHVVKEGTDYWDFHDRMDMLSGRFNRK